jgi:cytosine/adenosine deaminase-related metal-dependent hydrolase
VRICNIVHPTKGQSDVRIRDGHIAEISPHLTATDDEPALDGQGMLLLPGFVDAHTHLDKTLLGLPWHPHAAGPSVPDRIRYERETLRTLAIDPRNQSKHLLRHMLARGTTSIRTHVDIVPEIGLRHFHDVAQTRAECQDIMDVQIVAFPQLGVMQAPGTVELLREALRSGAEVVGGLDPISIDRDPRGQLDAVFALADEFGAEVDIHLHDRGEIGGITIDMIAERTAALGLHGRVTVSHAFCLGDVEPARQLQLIGTLARWNIAIMTHGPSAGIPSPPVRRLHEAGVRVFCGSDGVRDSWGPLNTGDMLERAFIVSYLNGFRDDAGLEMALRMATYAGAEVLGLKDYGIEVGCCADLVLVPVENRPEAVVAHPVREVVVKRGNVVARHGKCIV